LTKGCKFAGATVHRVTTELDHGQILDQAVVPVLPGDTADTLAARVLTQEHHHLPARGGAFAGRVGLSAWWRA
jgi:phosphoribosylglycinamide formyltransferase-1